MSPPCDLDEPSAPTKLGFQMQAALMHVRWTYSIFWQMSQEGLLVWSNGFYNGDVHTRKVDPRRSHEEVCGERSVQLRELFKSLSGRESKSEVENGCTSILVPEDLTDAEWFYLLSMSYEFKPSMGLPGLALETRSPVWLNNPSEADSKMFKRNLLAKSSGIKTVVCFPFADGVLEFGITQQVQEDPDLTEHISSFFIDVL
ncbi:hypothetical protein SUGI_0425740 [Cryptomeria japonica]|uniref:truncated basic helix-loop-helix protein A n=1 Tax=Cryptomeria japonica TaxID=3369 RepID=UPI0024089C69|nr:truncated basic helix-loop-helix protein A [Cryptomeria japonica]GLJ22622.1 hypothetical protein SUGI_0425740 [Cryptomeria japonica]